jgi:hypothetical protein
MSYQLEPRGKDSFGVIHQESNTFIGYVWPTRVGPGPRYRVMNDASDEVAKIKSLDEAVPTILAYYENHPQPWEGNSVRGYCRMTQVGDLQVGQDDNGRWLAYRTDCPLMRGAKPATFPSRQEAQRAADLHLFDGYENAAAGIDDGLSWLPDADVEWSWAPPPRSLEAYLEARAAGRR